MGGKKQPVMPSATAIAYAVIGELFGYCYISIVRIIPWANKELVVASRDITGIYDNWHYLRPYAESNSVNVHTVRLQGCEREKDSQYPPGYLLRKLVIGPHQYIEAIPPTQK